MVISVKGGANFRGDRKARRYWQAEARHLREIGTLTAQQIAQARVAFSSAVAKSVNPLHFLAHGAPVVYCLVRFWSRSPLAWFIFGLFHFRALP